MKNLTVMAAAFAAGLMTIAAHAQEEGAEVAVLSIDPDKAASPRKAAAPEQKKEEQQTKRDSGVEESQRKTPTKPADPEIRYRPLIVKYASENDVPLDLAHAVITIESNYKPRSLGKAGEVGLMQIKPATAKLMGYKGTPAGLFDPETNIKYGMKYLGKARKLGGGTTCGTILKYNAGHGAKRMNPTSRNYCSKVKRHLEQTTEPVVTELTDRQLERGV